MRFDNKIVLITGGNSGIGFSTAKRLISEGAQVIITGRNEEKLQQAVKELGPKAFGVVADSANMKDLDKLYQTITSKYGGLDGLFLNAGVAIMGPLETFSEKDYDHLMDINVKGVFFTLQKAIPVLKTGASVVINSSVVASKGNPMMAAYAATKAAVRSMARTFSADLLPKKGVRVNVVSPGPIETPIWNRDQVSLSTEMAEGIAQSIPMKRFGQPEEIAAAAAFLLSSDSSYIAGADIHTDGGASQL